jgi:hypothetical protein
VALLTFLPGVAMAGPADASSVPSAGALSIDSDPPGANVYVDGQFAGQTPVSVNKLAAGDHRVRVMKDGFLENGRTVSVSAKQPSSVQVKLTPNSPANAEAASQVTGGGGGGGGSKKWLWIGLAGGGAAAAIILATRSSNKAPTVSGVTANPTQGLASSTSVAFSANATDPDSGDTLTYAWDFGDASTGSGATPTHTYANAGTFNATVTVTDGKGGSATGSASVTIRNVTGTWNGTFGAFSFTMTLTQTGANITGTYRDSDGNGTCSGTVAAGNAVRVTVTQGSFLPFTFAGTSDAAVTTVSGNVTGLASAATFTMRR